MYDDLPNEGWLVFPVRWFVDDKYLDEGDLIPQGALAEFRVIFEELRHIHQARIKPGAEFRIVEGTRTMAIARVTKILHLNDDVETS